MSTKHNEDLWKKRKVKREKQPEPIVEYKPVRPLRVCICADFDGKDPLCEVHGKKV